jgi:hypothetical protein
MPDSDVTPAENGRLAPTLPFEDLDNGLVLNPPYRDHLTVITPPGGEPVYLMPAEDFVAMQKEFHDYRRTVALINAWRLTPNRTDSRLAALLAERGFSDGDARAMMSLIAWAEDYRREQDAGASAEQAGRAADEQALRGQ